MFDFFDIFKVDPTISDPAVAAASGITRDANGTLHQKHTAVSNKLADNLAAIATTAWGPVLEGTLIPSVEYTPIASKMLPKATNTAVNIGGKTQPLLGMSKSLPATRGTTALAQTANTVNKGNNWAKRLTGTLALGTAVGQGISEPSQKKATPVASRQRPKYAIGKYNQRSYNRLSQLQKVYGGDLIRQKDGSYFLRNKNGSFYGNGRALNAKTGKMQNYDLYGSGRFLNGNPKQSNSSNIVSTVLDSNYLYGYRGKPKTRMNNSKSFKTAWTNARNSGLGTFTWNGKSYNTMKKGETQQDYNSWLSKQNKAPQEASPIQGTPGYGIHVGNDGVTLSTPNGQTTDITNSHNLSEIIQGKQGQPSVNTQFLEQTASNLINPNQHKFDRGETKDFMRQNLVNPEDYSTSERRAFRHSISNDTGDWSNASKIMSDARINKSLSKSIDAEKKQFLVNPQLSKPNLGYDPSQNNQLVSLKFKQGGQMYKYATGAQMVQPQQASGQQGIEQQAIALVQAAMQGDQQANQTIQKIMQAAQQGDQQAAQVAQLLKAIVQKMKGSRKARLGAKLDYIKQSIGECPEGQEVVYFKKGGEICKVCAGKKMQDGGKSDPIKNFKKKKEQDAVKQAYQRNPYTRGKSAKEIAEMQRRNRQEAGAGKGENDANVAPWNYKKKR